MSAIMDTAGDSVKGWVEADLCRRAFTDARMRLARYLGIEDAMDVFDQALVLAKLSAAPETADCLWRVAVVLREHFPDGPVASTGRALAVSAFLLGAKGTDT